MRTIVFREFVRLVATDPGMRRVGVTIRSWDGSPEDDSPPTRGDLPWIRLSPTGSRQGKTGLSRLSIPMEVRVELLTDGTNVADSMNLWTMFEDLVLSSPFRLAMRAAGALRVIPSEAAFGFRSHYHKYEPTLDGADYESGTVVIEMDRLA